MQIIKFAVVWALVSAYMRYSGLSWPVSIAATPAFLAIGEVAAAVAVISGNAKARQAKNQEIRDVATHWATQEGWSWCCAHYHPVPHPFRRWPWRWPWARIQMVTLHNDRQNDPLAGFICYSSTRGPSLRQ